MLLPLFEGEEPKAEGFLRELIERFPRIAKTASI